MESVDPRILAVATVIIAGVVALPTIIKHGPWATANATSSDGAGAAATEQLGVGAAAPEQRKKPKKRPKKAAAASANDDEAEVDEATLSAALPELAVGQKVWHRQTGEPVVVVQVYFDDLPPYYSVRPAGGGSERSTVRMRLETDEERAAAAAAKVLKAAEARAEAAAEELLREEAAPVGRKGGKPNSRPSSGREARGTKKR